MRIGILETGRNREHLAERHGTYVDMFAALLSAADPSLEFTSYPVLDDQWPISIHECDAWLLTGSRHTAFDRLPWMLRLEALLREMMTARKPIIGICFGHQILAQALGGKVERAESGWSLGPHRYSIHQPPAWIEEAPESICLNAVHQDQVTAAPEGATVIASSPFCRNAILAYGDHALTFQAHPEFLPDFLNELLDALESNGLPPDVVADARIRSGDPEHKTDSAQAVRWVLDFLNKRSGPHSPRSLDSEASFREKPGSFEPITRLHGKEKNANE